MVALFSLLAQIVFLVLAVIGQFDGSFRGSVGYLSGVVYISNFINFLVALIIMVVFIAINYLLIIKPLQEEKYKGTDFLAILLGIVMIILTTVAPALLIPGVLILVAGILLLM